MSSSEFNEDVPFEDNGISLFELSTLDYPTRDFLAPKNSVPSCVLSMLRRLDILELFFSLLLISTVLAAFSRATIVN